MKQVDLKTVEDLYNACGVDFTNKTQLRTEINTGTLYTNHGNTYTCNNHTHNCLTAGKNVDPSK